MYWKNESTNIDKISTHDYDVQKSALCPESIDVLTIKRNDQSYLY